MTRRIRGTRYRKWKSPDGGFGYKYRSRYTGRVHLQFYDKPVKAWRFVCGKRDGGEELMYMGAAGDVTDDAEPVTCVRCNKHAPDVVERMDAIPDLEEFQ